MQERHGCGMKVKDHMDTNNINELSEEKKNMRQGELKVKVMKMCVTDIVCKVEVKEWKCSDWKVTTQHPKMVWPHGKNARD